MSQSKVAFLQKVHPFDTLPDHELESLAGSLSLSHQYKDMTLFVQGTTVLDYVHIVQDGHLEQYIKEGDKKLLRSFHSEGDIYGGLSVLFNNGISIRTVTTLEDSTLYRLPKDLFLDVCARYPDFTRFFSESFQRNMLQQPYVAFIAKSSRQDRTDRQAGFLNQSLTNVFSRHIVSCSESDTVREAAQRMTEHKRSSIVVLNDGGGYSGLLTDHDIREKVVAAGRSLDTTAAEILSTPLVSLPADSRIFEAILLMMQRGIKHLAITGPSEEILGIATEEDLLLTQGRSPVFLMHELQNAESIGEIASRYRQLPGLVRSLLDSGAKAEHLNRVITAVSDAILSRVLDFALAQTGPPPARFAFMLLGSEGRREQTLKTDQDNAIVFEDVPEAQKEATQSFFLRLGKIVSDWLNDIGFVYCDFDIMASNPDWCQPLSTWKEYFGRWIRAAEPENLLQASIFFDFRCGYGDCELIEELNEHLFSSLGGWKGFFRHLAENALHFKPPLDFFGNFVLQTKGEQKNTLDIKTPMRLIVDFARIMALKNRIPQTNTLERLREMQRSGALEREDAQELEHAYAYQMQVRLSHQAALIHEEQRPPDNFIHPKRLTHIERQSLKEAFKRIRMAQGKMRMELTQDTGIG
jgi:CBS domain-containing protein